MFELPHIFVSNHLCLFIQLGITTLSPAGLLVGAKSIVCHNKQLRTEMKELERELSMLQGQNDFMVNNYHSTFCMASLSHFVRFRRFCAKSNVLMFPRYQPTEHLFLMEVNPGFRHCPMSSSDRIT